MQPRHFALLHFIKADTRSYPGSFDVLMQETAKLACSAGCAFINFGDDMGMSSLRVSKLRYRPVRFLKKYTVKLARAPEAGASNLRLLQS
jgi:hypothetical protein